MRLTDLAIQRLPVPATGQKTYWEEGFGVRVSQGGTKSFVVMYGPKRELKTIGRYPAMSLKEARQAANLHLAVKVPSRSTKRLSEARTAYLEDCEKRCRPGTVANYRLLLNQLTKEKLDQVTRADVGQNAHAIMAAKIFFNWCIKNDLIDRNPFANERVSYGQRSRVLSEKEIKAIWHYSDPPFTDHLKLLLLTGQRRSQFSQFEIRDDTIWFPADVMKGKREHTIPLLPLAQSYAEKLKPFNGWSKCKARMDKTVLIPHWTIHDLRRTFATVHASLGTPVHVIEKLLDHQSGSISGVASIYNRYSYIKEARAALEIYEAHMQTVTA
jgi:integrase